MFKRLVKLDKQLSFAEVALVKKGTRDDAELVPVERERVRSEQSPAMQPTLLVQKLA